MICCCANAEQTQTLAERLAKTLHAGAVLALYGSLAAGKTCFSQGIARGLGITDLVTSPTFTIISEYIGALPLYHMDMYRLGTVEEFADIGGEDFLYGNGVCIIEWAEIINTLLPPHTIHIHFSVLEQNNRKITITNAPHTFIPQEFMYHEYSSS